jgi:hypothetical protein
MLQHFNGGNESGCRDLAVLKQLKDTPFRLFGILAQYGRNG